MTTPQRPWLTQDEAAERLGVSVRTVERLRASGRLRTFRAVPDGAPRFRVEDVDAVMVPDPQPATRTT